MKREEILEKLNEYSDKSAERNDLCEALTIPSYKETCVSFVKTKLAPLSEFLEKESELSTETLKDILDNINLFQK